MPVTLMGFCLQGFSPRTEPSSSLEAGYPLGVAGSAIEIADVTHLQGLAPRRDPPPLSQLLAATQAATLMTFPLSRDFPRAALAPPSRGLPS
jgi:hypothetical protein